MVNRVGDSVVIERCDWVYVVRISQVIVFDKLPTCDTLDVHGNAKRRDILQVRIVCIVNATTNLKRR